ncbi:MAG: hypothetical protein M0R03_13085 [Novosphingobium sp.]|nr:hypothetical protein [Novosphingobium sp.]
MNKTRTLELRKSALKAYEKVGLEKKGISFKNFFRRIKKNYKRITE